ncbi:MAG: hypothetical protein AB1413_03110 [Thermodesulfobacteriota bacterium]
MSKEYPILLAIHNLPFMGERFLPGRWENFIHDLRLLLRSSGIESPDSRPELLLFNYDHPHTAITAFFESFEQVKREYQWERTRGTLPLQIVLHLEKKGEVPPPFRVASGRIWEGVQHETIHVSRALKLQWEQVVAGRNLPPHQFDAEESGLYPLRFASQSGLKRERLFPHRQLMVKSGQRECFYCGMATHKAGSCPSRLLATENRAVQDVGYLSFAELAGHFRTAMANTGKLEKILAAGVSSADLRENKTLQVFVAYFDLTLIYQPRYLRRIAFSVHPVWDGTGQSERIKVDSRNLQLGLDCLRVGQYNQAYELLMTENQLMGGKQFYATVGLAFVALERDRLDEMGHHLQIAAGMAACEKEKIYAGLLLSRYLDLVGHPWKAEHAIQSILNLYVDCSEALYRKVQLLVREGQGAKALKLIAKLIDADRLYFMTALMDPVLLPVQGLVEDILVAHVQHAGGLAVDALTKANADYEALKKWFDGEDADLQENLHALDQLEEQYARKAYYDFLDVAARARQLSHAAPRLQEAKLDELNERVDEAVLHWGRFNAMWEQYPYRPLFRHFQELLRRGKRRLVEARAIASESLAMANSRLAEGFADVKALSPIAERMEKVRIALDTLRVFGKKLAVTELFFCALLFLLYPILVVLLADQLGDTLVQMLRSSGFQRNILFVVTLIVAPAIAFGLTVRSIAD